VRIREAQLARSVALFAVVFIAVTTAVVGTGCSTDLTKMSSEDLKSLATRMSEIPATAALQEAVSEIEATGGTAVVRVEETTYIVASLGTRPTAGYGIAIKEIAAKDEVTLRLVFVEQEPADDEMVAQVITAPVVVYKVEGLTPEISIEAELETSFEGALQVDRPGRGQEVQPGSPLTIGGHLFGEGDRVVVFYGLVDGNQVTLAQGSITPQGGAFEAEISLIMPTSPQGLMAVSAQGATRNYFEQIPLTFTQWDTGLADLTLMSPDQLAALVHETELEVAQEMAAEMAQSQEVAQSSEEVTTAADGAAEQQGTAGTGQAPGVNAISRAVEEIRQTGGVRQVSIDGYTYIIVALGERQTSGYSIEVGEVAASGPETLYIVFHERRPSGIAEVEARAEAETEVEAEVEAEAEGEGELVPTWPVAVYRVAGYEVEPALFRTFEGILTVIAPLPDQEISGRSMLVEGTFTGFLNLAYQVFDDMGNPLANGTIDSMGEDGSFRTVITIKAPRASTGRLDIGTGLYTHKIVPLRFVDWVAPDEVDPDEVDPDEGSEDSGGGD